MRKKYRPLPTQARLIEVMNYEPETGSFTRACDRGRWKRGQPMGTKSNDGYININVDYCIYRAHRLAWVFMTGQEPKSGIDHANGDRADNRWTNLREATQTQNLGNKRPKSSSNVGLKGVSKNRGRFQACAFYQGKRFYLGTFSTAQEAKAAYDAAAKVIHGEFFRS